MKKILASCLLLASLNQNIYAQKPAVRAPSLGFSVIANDYSTAEQIRNSSLSAVLRKDGFASFKDMGLGVAFHYIKGFTPHIDLNASLGGSFVKFNLPGKTNAQDDFLLEIDASANFKMFAEGTTVNPYLIAGIGASKYTNVIGAFMPLGGGFSFNVLNEVQLFTQFQYRVPVTTEANKHHFQLSFGIAAFL